MKQYFLNIWNTPVIHAAMVVIGGAVTGAIISIVNGYATTGAFPTLSASLRIIGIAAAAALVAYYNKQGGLGSSNITPKQ
jgi:hypothetical protein